jgi:hypothetical protein
MVEYMKDIIRLNDIPNITVNEFGLSDKERKCDMQFGSGFHRSELNLSTQPHIISSNFTGTFF